MSKLRFPGSAFFSAIGCVAIAWLAFCSRANAQHAYLPDGVRVSVPKVTAKSPEASDVLMASLETIVQDGEVCCGKDSALEDSVERANPASLKNVAAKLHGRHLLSDGRPIMVTAQYIAPDEIRGYMLIETLQRKHAMVMLWKSHLYVLYGAIYVEDYDPDSGQGIDNVAKLLLIDTRYSDARRITEFNRETDDFSKLQGLLWVASEPQ